MSTEALEIVVTTDETVPASTLDKRLRHGQTKVILELVAAPLSRVHSVSRPLTKKNPTISRVFQRVHSGGRI